MDGGAYVFKEKMKLLKGDLKRLNKDMFGNLEANRKVLIRRMNELDNLAENMVLNEQEAKVRQDVMAEFWRISKLNESLLF